MKKISEKRLNGTNREENEKRMRVCLHQRGTYEVLGADGTTMRVRVSGKWMHDAKDRTDYPVIGDWVRVRTDAGVMTGMDARKNLLTRIGADPSGRVRQPIAANVDWLLCCMALGQELRAARVERMLAAAAAADIPAAVLLTKADLCADPAAAVQRIQDALPGVECMAISVESDSDKVRLRERIARENATVALVGASGVGKSTLCNALMGENYLKTGEVREDDMRGRHTTTQRELIALPMGGAIIDTPGMRAFALDESDVGSVFETLEEMSARCRFRDCTHTGEPGCALRAAAEKGEIDKKTLSAYVKLLREQERRKRRR